MDRKFRSYQRQTRFDYRRCVEAKQSYHADKMKNLERTIIVTMRSWSTAINMLADAFAVVLISFYGATSGLSVPYDPSVIASWVQAVGSIAAIIGAFVVGRYQAEEQHKSATKVQDAALARRWLTVKALLDIVYQQCLDIEPSFDGESDFGNLAFVMHYDAQSFSQALGRVQAIPLFELDSEVLVSSVVGVSDMAQSVKSWADEGCFRARGTRRSLDASDRAVKEAARHDLALLKSYYQAAVRVTGGTAISTARAMI